MERPAAAAGGGGGASSAAAAPDAGAAAATQARGDAASQALEPPGVGERLEVSTRTVSARRQRCALASFERPRRAAVAARVPRPGALMAAWSEHICTREKLLLLAGAVASARTRLRGELGWQTALPPWRGALPAPCVCLATIPSLFRMLTRGDCALTTL